MKKLMTVGSVLALAMTVAAETKTFNGSTSLDLADAGAASADYTGVDITDFVRRSGTGTCMVQAANGTMVYDGLVENAFDGITGEGTTDERVLLMNSDKNTPYPASLIYTILDSGLPGLDFKVDSFTLYRVATGWAYLERSATEFMLRGWDGKDWNNNILFTTSGAQTWDSETLSHTYTIPEEKRGCFHKYLFTVTGNGGDANWTGFQELVFNGEIVRGSLIWNGAEGARWNATDANWLDSDGNMRAWIPGAKAIFSEQGTKSIVVDGTNEVGGIVFAQTNVYTIAGGALAMSHGSEIIGGGGDVGGIIASEIIEGLPVNAYPGIVNGQNNYFPADPKNTKQGAWARLWRNCRLAGITNFTGAIIQQKSTPRNAAPYHYENNGDTASVQFQCKPNALLCAKVLLMQVDADVYGRVAYLNFTWGSHSLGDDFDGEIDGRWAVNVFDNNVVTNGLDDAEAYGFYGVTPQGGEWNSEPLKVSASRNVLSPAPAEGSFLPKNADDPYTGDAVLCFPGRKVADLCSLSSADLYYTDSKRPSSLQYFTNTAAKATVQVQGNTGEDGVGAQLCVKVEFTDGVDGVYARAVYAKYDWGVKTVHDFDPVPADGDHKAIIYAGGSETRVAYGVKNIVAEFKGERVTFGASAIALDREITGDGTVRFAPLVGLQAVTVPTARTLGKVAFGGTTAFSFAEGASLSVQSAEIEDAAAVLVVGASDANLLRIGTTKCLSKDQCEHFTVNGSPAKQNDDGWMVRKPGMVLILR